MENNWLNLMHLLIKKITNHILKKEIVERITAKNKIEINALNKLISLRNLTYQFKNKELVPKRFRYFDAQLGFLRKITDGDTSINKVIKTL